MHIAISDLNNQLQLTKQQQSEIVGGERKLLAACVDANNGNYLCVPSKNVGTGNKGNALQASYFVPSDPSYPDKFNFYSDFTLEAI